MTGDIVAMFQCLQRHVDPSLLGKNFDLGLFLQARLCILTRVFHLDGDSCMVPVSDLFNHSEDPTVAWSWDDEGKAMVLSATRAHEPGEELLISYGHRSNVLLFRTYGFTLPPWSEPGWTVLLLGTARPVGLFQDFLPARHQSLVLHLESDIVQTCLVTALNACKDRRRDPEEFLRRICAECMARYEEDSALAPALAGLRLARAADPTSAAWWDHVGEGAGWEEQCLRVKMSEYLCLLAHAEVLDVLAGSLAEDQCLALAAKARKVLVEGFKLLREDLRFSLNVVDGAKDT
mmetsp:Transcript_128367/g.359333  ORF Transcript_128367/g.359333 Transcript_128367/m.359333 type:complete len:291 (+) Transcript_128367:2-874(+)